ncbi:MAG: amino acid permease [Myxococcales bacterium]|nr:amino acid permease [Myxococcales bacterium]
MTSPPAAKLSRSLGLWASMGIVVGTIIGTGVFLKTAVMAQQAGSAQWVLIAWGLAGVLSLAGALTYAELGAMFPNAGGEYVYLRQAYGPYAGYLFGWTRFWIGTPGSIAAYAVGSATFLADALPIAQLGGIKVVALILIAVFTLLGCLKVHTGGTLAVLLTALKVVLILALGVAAFVLPPNGAWQNLAGSADGTASFPGMSAFGLTIISALWAYDGWNNLPMAAGEVSNPQRTMPRALIFGTLGVLAVYALINVAYFYALPFAEVVTANSARFEDAPSLATKVASTFLGPLAGGALAFAMTVSALSAMHGSILTGARVPYAIARDGLAPRWLADLSVKAVPVKAVLIQGVCSVILTLTGSFDQLTNAVIFSSWVFYTLNAVGVVLLRRRRPELARPYRVPGFPVIPLLFALLSGLLLFNTVLSSTRDSLYGLLFMAISVPFYFLARRWHRVLDGHGDDA